jgi:Flp pilus assembly protein TadD
MASASHWQLAVRGLRKGSVIAALSASLMLGACGQVLNPAGDLASITGSPQRRQAPAASPAPQAVAHGGISNELLKATDYWGKVYEKNPRDLEPALNYARNLKAMGEKRRALGVLQQVSLYHGQDRELASEYGRLALDLDQVKVAKQLLAIADDPARPDWRVVSARGAALAKEGAYNEAIPYFQRALQIAPDQASVMSNLALAYAMNGEPAKAEPMLRQAAAADGHSPRIRQNLALVLGLQGKYDEAKLVAARDIPMTNASENADYLRQVVKLDPKSVPNSEPAAWSTEANVAVAEAPAVDAVPVARIADARPLPTIEDPAAVNDQSWVVDTAAAANATPSNQEEASARKVMSVTQMAAQFAVPDEAEVIAERAWSPQVAQSKR